MNRKIYDRCEELCWRNQSTAPIGWTLDADRFVHVNRCRADDSVVGGTSVSADYIYIDVESDLRGQTRPLTQCPAYKYLPRCDKLSISREYIKPVVHPIIDGRPGVPLPECAAFRDYFYRPHLNKNLPEL